MINVLHGDMLALLPTLPENSIDAVVTDPPYCLDSIRKRFSSPTAKPAGSGKKGEFGRLQRGFMNQTWDNDTAMQPETWSAVFRVMKPGAHGVVFGGCRTFHRIAIALEDAGFEIRDTLMWLFGTGFPKNYDVAKGIQSKRKFNKARFDNSDDPACDDVEKPGIVEWATGEWTGKDMPVDDDIALQWQGWGSALKPAYEPILLIRKPLDGTIVENVLEHGVGGINIDACRVGVNGGTARSDPSTPYCGGRKDQGGEQGWRTGHEIVDLGKGRWPANILLDSSDEVLQAFARFGESKSSKPSGTITGQIDGIWKGKSGFHQAQHFVGYEDHGTPARFFNALGYSEDEMRFHYSGKAGKKDRAGSKHPTVKPISLMRWLCKLICPVGGTILDPFAGSGSTGAAAFKEGMNCTLIEQSEEYVKDIERRIAALEKELIQI